jgi:N-acetylmuramoyl-L-alanine amidase
VKDRRFRAPLIVLGLLLPVLVGAQAPRPAAPPPSTPPPAAAGSGRSSVTLEGKEIAVPVTIGPNGPMFGLTPLVDALGGKVTSDESGESITLRLADKDVVIGPGNAIVTVGDNIVSLSQPPSRGEGGLQVPVDFLKKTFGDLLGFSFEWHPETSRLTIARRGSREMGVTLDVVHLQGMTTVVLQFPDEPHYQIDRSQAGLIKVQMLSDRLTPPAPKEVQDPLVQGVAIEPQQVRIQLAPAAQAESYVLEHPFRLVFDVHPTASVEIPTQQPAERTQQTPGIHTVVIDPGHGNMETGAIGPGGIQEKDLTLQFARDLAGKLGRLGVQTVLTRNDDSLVALDTRAAIANQNKADLFISIHLNSSLGAGANGTETYFLSPQASDPRAARSAAAENSAPAAGAAAATGAPPAAAAEQQDVDLILWDLAQSHHLSESQRFANMIQAELNETLQIKDRGVKQAPFRVLKGATMPAVLVELGFISNPEEEKKLQDSAYRDQLLEALVRAVAHYKATVEGTPAAAPGGVPGSVPGGAPGATGAPPPPAGTPAPTPSAAAPAPPPAARPAPKPPGKLPGKTGRPA